MWRQKRGSSYKHFIYSLAKSIAQRSHAPHEFRQNEKPVFQGELQKMPQRGVEPLTY